MALNKTELIGAVAQHAGITKVEADKVVKTTLDCISNELAKGGSVSLIGFGTFSVYKRAARTGKNPRTGATIQISSKKVPKFKAGKQLADMVHAQRAAAAKKAAPKAKAKAAPKKKR